ncbi:branched-chain amino acid ABC transporter permease [Natronomonas sp. CBA1123]|jgi:branched-chain amino acid transport system permease protein|uniref:branched-chain amino acid ABC transporter permease n=1 Tax=Natronomonas sp. CBA1123 TaxID=2668070 RepID=UPI0012E9E501|nr:branched-chain amino acid ABC transporter permease [Natronomonas sp. CBA1123]MUV86797.1 branched-chain amino acid ABC transporter permease [Natronomonas sp. CBA1123]
MPVDLVKFVINAAAISSLYLLVAIGFTLIFGVGEVLNFAHGALLTVGAYTSYHAVNAWGMGLWAALALSAVVSGVLGAVLYRGVVQYIRDQPVVTIIVTIILGFAIEAVLGAVFGGGTITLSSPVPGGVEVLGREVQTHFVFVFVLSWTVVVLLVSYINHTPTGKAVQATNMSKRGASLVGIDADNVNTYVWAVAAALAGVAGVLLLAFQTGSPSMGLDPMVLSFSIVVLGGLGSLRGSIVGAYIIGFLDTAMTTLIAPSLTGLAGLVMLVVVLLVRPQGLFGRSTSS